MKEKIPDPIEISESKIDRLVDAFIDEYACMQCGKRHDYQMVCASVSGDGPAICYDCLGYDPFEEFKRISDASIHG